MLAVRQQSQQEVRIFLADIMIVSQRLGQPLHMNGGKTQLHAETEVMCITKPTHSNGLLIGLPSSINKLLDVDSKLNVVTDPVPA